MDGIGPKNLNNTTLKNIRWSCNVSCGTFVLCKTYWQNIIDWECLRGQLQISGRNATQKFEDQTGHWFHSKDSAIPFRHSYRLRPAIHPEEIRIADLVRENTPVAGSQVGFPGSGVNQSSRSNKWRPGTASMPSSTRRPRSGGMWRTIYRLCQRRSLQTQTFFATRQHLWWNHRKSLARNCDSCCMLCCQPQFIICYFCQDTSWNDGCWFSPVASICCRPP